MEAAVIYDVRKWKRTGFDIIPDWYFLWITWGKKVTVLGKLTLLDL